MGGVGSVKNARQSPTTTELGKEGRVCSLFLLLRLLLLLLLFLLHHLFLLLLLLMPGAPPPRTKENILRIIYRNLHTVRRLCIHTTTVRT